MGITNNNQRNYDEATHKHFYFSVDVSALSINKIIIMREGKKNNGQKSCVQIYFTNYFDYRTHILCKCYMCASLHVFRRILQANKICNHTAVKRWNQNEL